MKLRSALVGLSLICLLAVLAACDTNTTPTPVATSISVSNPPTTVENQPTTGATSVNEQPTTAAPTSETTNNQPTTAPEATSTTASNQAAPSTTPHVTGRVTTSTTRGPAIRFMPIRGGPGAVIYITGGNFTPGQTVVLRIGVPNPIGEPLATVQADDKGMWNTNIKIPATDPQGKTITTSNMQIVAMDQNNQVIVSAPFRFTP